MPLATLTHTGRAAIAKAMSARPLHLAWGAGDPVWEDEGAELPSLVTATALVNELGRRTPSVIGFVEPDEAGAIVIPVSVGSDGSVQEAVIVWSRTSPPPISMYSPILTTVTPPMPWCGKWGVFMDTAIKEGLPPGQRYFTPAELEDPGLLLAVQIITPPMNRSASVRQSVEFVLPI